MESTNACVSYNVYPKCIKAEQDELARKKAHAFSEIAQTSLPAVLYASGKLDVLDAIVSDFLSIR